MMLETLYHQRHINPLPSGQPVLGQDKHVYVHGGGFGLGTEVIADPIWARILQEVEPETYRNCDAVLNGSKRILDARAAGKIIFLLENSPVASAYARLKIGSHFTPELDIWIDPATPRVDRAKVTHGSVFAVYLSHLPATEQTIFHRLLQQSHRVSEWFTKYSLALTKALEAKRVHLGDLQIRQVCIDVKSPWTTPRDVRNFITEFQQITQVNVKYVGSFNINQISDLPTGSGGILFFHGLWDLEQALKQHKILPERVMFNGADLLNPGPVVNHTALNKLERLVTQNSLHVGIYIQETDAAEEAVQLLIREVQTKPDLFKGGFVLGGRSDGKTPNMLKGYGQGPQKPVLSQGWLAQIIQVVRDVYRRIFNNT